MTTFAHGVRPIDVRSPLPKDALLLNGFKGYEAISHLYDFQLGLLAEHKTEVPFDKLLGQEITVSLVTPKGTRYFSGICNRLSQGRRDHKFTYFDAQIVPKFWLLTKRLQSRIFQHSPVTSILLKVLEGLDVEYLIRGTFQPRDFCVQYHESDYNFACRLMEEEGIYFYFKHAESSHKLVLANTPQGHPNVPDPSSLIFDDLAGGKRAEDRVYFWEKIQELRSGKYTLWDHCFELPHKHLEAEKTIQDSVAVGKVTHKLRVGNNDNLELYEFPGEYAQRFDGVDRGGGDRPLELRKLYMDNQRTTGIRMEQEAAPSVVIQGAGDCRQLITGHKFTLEKHYDADGAYVLTSVMHMSQNAAFGPAGGNEGFSYQNNFTCIPLGLPFRPSRLTPKPVVQGTQTAVVVGPPGQEIFTDKYGRVKVQFHWDRQGKNNADSSCWVRVAQGSAGKRWGTSFWPRIGQEVIVDFLEGDPDQPIIVGTVYNADQMPPYLGNGLDPKHKNDNKVSGFKSCSTPGGKGYNEIRFDDTKGKEQIFIHAQKDLEIRVGGSMIMNVSGTNSDHKTVDGEARLEVKKASHTKVGGDARVMVAGEEHHIVGGFGFDHYQTAHRTTTGGEDLLEAPLVIVEADSISLKGAGGFIVIDGNGVTIVGNIVKINSGGAPIESSIGTAALGPMDKLVKKPEAPNPADQSKTGQPSTPGGKLDESIPPGSGKPSGGGFKKPAADDFEM